MDGGAHRGGRLSHMDGLGDIRLGGPGPLVAVAQLPGEGGHGQFTLHQRGGGAEAHAVGRHSGGRDPARAATARKVSASSAARRSRLRRLVSVTGT